MEIDGSTSKKSAECLDDNDSLPPKESSSEYKDSKTFGLPIDKEKLQSNPDTSDSAASFKGLNETYRAKEELRENVKLLRTLKVTRNTLEPLQEYPDGMEDDDVFDNLEVISTICSTPRKNEAGFETRHNNSYSDDDSNETMRSYAATNTLNLQHVVEVLKTVASDVEDDSVSLLVSEKANVANSGEYLDPSAYIEDFSKTTSFLNLKNLMDKLLKTKEDKAVVRDMAILYFENLNKCLCGYFSQLEGKNDTKMIEEKISLGHLKNVFEGFRNSWIDAVDIMDLKDNPKDTDKEPEETNKSGNSVSEKILDPSESYNNGMETQGISMNLSSQLFMKKVDSEKEVFRNKISRCDDNTYLRPKELAEEPTKTNVAKGTTVSLYKTAAIPERSMQLLDDFLKIFANVMKFAPSNHKPTNKPENSIGELKNFDDTKELSVPSYAEECVADVIEDHGDSNNILVCSESECSVKKEESKKPNCNEARTSSFHVYVNDSNEGLEITDKNENPCVGSGRGKSYDDLIVESKELDDENVIERSSQTGTSIKDSRKTEVEDISYPVSVCTDLKVTLEVQKEGVRTEKSNDVFDREDSHLEKSNDDLRKIDGTHAANASVEEDEDSDLQETNEEQKKTVNIDNYHSLANADSILEVSIEEQKEDEKTEKPIAVINRRDLDSEESFNEPKNIDGPETTVTNFDEEDFVPKESNKEPEKIVPDIYPCSVNEVPDHEVSIEGKTEANSTEKSNPVFHTKVSYPEESIDEFKQVDDTKDTTIRFEEEDAYLQESNEDHKKTVDTDKCPSYGSVDTNHEVSIEEPKESDSAEKPTTVLDGRYSDTDKSVDELKQIYRTEATVSSFNQGYFNPDESNEESKKEVQTDMSSSSIIAGPDLEVSIDGQKGTGSTEKSNPVLEREISYPEESVNELRQIDGTKATTASVEEEDPDLQESIEEQKENCSTEKRIAVTDKRESDTKESIDEPKQYDRTASFDDEEDFDPEESNEKPKKTVITGISPCSADDDLDVRKESDPDVSIGEPKQFVAEATSSIFEEEKCFDPQESNFEPIMNQFSDSDLEVSILEQKEADSIEKPTGAFDREDLNLEEYNEKPKKVPSTEENTTSSDSEVSDHQEPNEEPRKTVDPDTYPCSVRSGYDLEVVIVEQKEPDGTKKPREDFNSEYFLLEVQKQSHGTETAPTRSDKEDTYSQEPYKELSVVDVSQHLDESDFNSNESIEEIKKLDNTELSSCTDGQESEELTNKLAPLEDIDMSLACSEKVCLDMKEGSKGPDNNVVMNNSDSTDANPTNLNEESDIKDMNGKEECSEPSIEESTKIEGLMDKFACSNTEDSSLIKSNVEMKEVEDYITISSKSADNGSEVSIRENKGNGLEMYTAFVDSNPTESVEELKYIDDADEIVTCHEDKNSSIAFDSNPIESVDKLKYIDDADEIVTCKENKDSSTKDVEEPKEIGDTEVVATISVRKVCEPPHSNEEASNIEDSEIKSFYMKTIGLKLKDLTEKEIQSDDSKPKETEESTKTATTEKISESSVDNVPIEPVVKINDLTEEATKFDDSKPKETEESTETATTEKIAESSVDNVPIETVVKLNDLTEEATKSDDDSKRKETEDSIKTATTENISESSVAMETVKVPKPPENVYVCTDKADNSSERLVEYPSTCSDSTLLSERSIDNVPIETVRDPKTPENVSVCTDKADNSSERLVEYPSTSSNDLSRLSPETDESISNINPASVLDIYNTAKREKIEKAVNKSCLSKGRKVACPGSEENVREDSLSRSIPHEHFISDSTFVKDLYRFVLSRKKYPKNEFIALPNSPFSVQMQKDVRIMLFYKEREMYFVAKQHKESPMEMAQQAVSHFVRRPFCPKTFLWLFLYICNHFVLLMGDMDNEHILPLFQMLCKCIGDLRALGEFTDETWHDVEVVANTISMALRLTLTFENDDSA